MVSFFHTYMLPPPKWLTCSDPRTEVQDQRPLEIELLLHLVEDPRGIHFGLYPPTYMALQSLFLTSQLIKQLETVPSASPTTLPSASPTSRHCSTSIMYTSIPSWQSRSCSHYQRTLGLIKGSCRLLPLSWDCCGMVS